MRKVMATVFAVIAFLGAIAATGYYVFFMWGLDWGQMGTRGHNLMLVLMLIGAVFVFLIVLILLMSVVTWIDPEAGK